MDEKIADALKTDRTIDITTTGAKSGEQRRIEIWFHNIEDELYITGLPGKRDWYANMVAHPEMTFHLKHSVQADIPATATPITDEDAKRAVFEKLLPTIERADQIEEWVTSSPLVQIDLHFD